MIKKPVKKQEVSKAQIIKLCKGLIKIAELAMPDTYFATDSRVNLARKILRLLKEQK